MSNQRSAYKTAAQLVQLIEQRTATGRSWVKMTTAKPRHALLWKTTQHHSLSLSQKEIKKKTKTKTKTEKKRVTGIKHGKLHSTILSMVCPAQGPLQWKKTFQWHKSGDTVVTNNTAYLSSKSTTTFCSKITLDRIKIINH